MMREWTIDPGPSAEKPGAQDRVAQLDGHSRYDTALGDWLGGFIDGWL